jgi:t-SNARE complex subunit (syntaxin)
MDEGARDVAQAVEYLHHKCEALKSNPSTTKKKMYLYTYVYIILHICVYIHTKTDMHTFLY